MQHDLVFVYMKLLRKPRTNHLTTQVLDVTIPGLGTIKHLKVRRLDGKSGITWDQLQAIKNDVLGKSIQCIEVYPAESEVVNQVNCRHLWSIPNGYPLPSLV